MDEQRFDDLTRAMAGSVSRREVVRGLVGGALAGAFGVFGVAGAEAKPGKGKGKPKPGKVGICHATRSAKKPWVYITVSERAVKAHEKHGDVVVDLSSSLEHCGGCGQACETPVDACLEAVCLDGACGTQAVTCDDGNECTIDSCDAEAGCQYENVDDGTLCNGGAGTCTGGVCL